MSSESTIPNHQTASNQPRSSWLGRPRRVAVLVAILMIGVVVAGTVYVVQTNQATAQAQRDYQAQRQQLDKAVQAARGQGLTAEDLAPITSRQKQVERASPPMWIGGRPDFYHSQAAMLNQLRGSLQGRQTQLINDAKSSFSQNQNDIKTAFQQDQQAGVDSRSMTTLQQRLDSLIKSEQAARALSDFRRVNAQARQLVVTAQDLARAQQLETQAIQQAAQTLIAQNGGDINKLRQIANFASARNEASIAAYLDYGHEFKGDYGQLDIAAQRMERYAPMAPSSDVNQVAQAAAAVQRYGPQIHQLLFAQLPPKFIVVSFQDQHFWAYQNGQAVTDTATTTGVRGVTDYGTDFGPLKVASKDHPWKMHSPYPKGSQYYYPDTVVQWAVWFTPTKLESFHDASWEPDSQLGPGSQYDTSTRSHGCIHIPAATAQWMYNWADIGTPVIVYPGNGQPVSEQISEVTTDDQGNPKASA
jgi:lipoprotein-anchoring transpeptidase ErfK/SrfK